MTQLKLVIAGAYYFDGETILIPHFTGEYYMVDCTKYEKIPNMIGRYDKEYFQSVKDDFITFEGVKYFNAEYSPIQINEWELLSDLSSLEFTEEEREF